MMDELEMRQNETGTFSPNLHIVDYGNNFII